MTARTRKWVVLSALGLLALDLVLVAVAAPRARGWLEGARASALVRAGATAWRDLDGPDRRGVGDLSAALLERFTHRSTRVYALILPTSPRGAARAAGVRARREARMVMLETRCDQAMSAECPSSGAMPDGPSPACPSSSCPRDSAPPGTTARWSSAGMPTSMPGVTLE